MKRLKTFLIYGLLIAVFWILSDFLINVGINSTYKPIERIDNTAQIDVYQAEATLINGRMKGVIKNSDNANTSQKYIKLQLYSARDVEIGTRYIEIEELQPEQVKPFELYFKIRGVKYYKLEIVDEKGPEENLDIDLIPKDLTKGEILWGVIIALMLW